ncbi:STAS domain-containing protein (plasmid) [Streptomyces sp. LRE541]|uniref:STAS domain-containing protein n=1 Tax=Streptomyces sp. LRE541 TaxID=2931983 RepID=UPI00200EF39C|nr:STAS domain-containing protein [Streptomyces sp. LRE541]UPZ34582.1 STAS domain-containing protein [Streptomyces sp. LRE541]
MLVTTTTDGITAVLSPHGEIDSHTLSALLTAARKLPQSVTQVTWNFEETAFMDVAGLHLLFQQRLAYLDTGRTVAVSGLHEQPLHLLQLMQELFPAGQWHDFLPQVLPAAAA